LVGLALKKQLGIKFIFDMRGFWADERVEGGLWNLHHPLYKQVYTYFKRKEKTFLQEADYTICLTHQAEDEIHSWQKCANVPIQVISCCVDTKLFVPISKNQPGNFTISYLGSLGTWYMLDEMLYFYKRLLLQKPQAVFLFITPDSPQLILKKAQELGIPIENICVKRAERQEVPLLLAASHISIFFIKPSYSKKASSPTKMGEILSMGIPVICNAGVGDTDYLFETYAPGLLVESLDNESYDKAVNQIDTILLRSPNQLRDIALNYFDLQKGVDLYAEVYQQLSE
jgi:glycosyltransferase involved in cell wall biosynthesis